MNLEYPPSLAALSPMAYIDWRRSEQVFWLEHMFFSAFFWVTLDKLAYYGAIPGWHELLQTSMVCTFVN